MTARRTQADERQADLFGVPLQPLRPAARGSPRARKPPVEEPAAGPDTIAVLAERIGPADLDELVQVLPDEALAHLALASARQLRRRVDRGARGGAGKGRGQRGPLQRAVEDLAREWATPAGEEW